MLFSKTGARAIRADFHQLTPIGANLNAVSIGISLWPGKVTGFSSKGESSHWPPVYGSRCPAQIGRADHMQPSYQEGTSTDDQHVPRDVESHHY